MIQIRNVSYSYTPEKLVLNDISCDFKNSSVTSIIGESGAGKSTMLGIILGELKASSGNVYSLVSSVNSIFGYVPQNSLLIPTLTIYENLLLPIITKVGKNKLDINARISSYLTLFKLPQDILTRRPKELSGGQCQRIAVIRALIGDIHTLVLDEPFASLDYDTSICIASALVKISRDRDIPVIIVTHNVKLALLSSDKIIEIANGTIARNCYTNEMISDPTGYVRRSADIGAFVPEVLDFTPRAYALEVAKAHRSELVKVKLSDDKSVLVKASAIEDSLIAHPTDNVFLASLAEVENVQ